MLIAVILLSLGIPLWLFLGLLIVALLRRRWLRSRPGTFKCALRLVAGDSDEVPVKWKRGYGLWVRDVFIFRGGPTYYRDVVLPIDAVDLDAVRQTTSGEVKRLGQEPTVAPLCVENGANVEVAAAAEDTDKAMGPFKTEPEAQKRETRA